METIPRQYGLCVDHWVLFLCGGGTSPSVLAKEVSNKEAKPLPHVVRNVTFQKNMRHSLTYSCAALFSVLRGGSVRFCKICFGKIFLNKLN
jgi:hypothetical protein